MPWAAGSYTKGNAATGGWTGDASSGIGIEAGRHDTQDNDFATGINQCLNKDGSNAMTGPLNLGGSKVISIANGTAATDATAWGQLTNGAPLYIDTANNRIGVGTSAPAVLFDVNLSANSAIVSRLYNSNVGASATAQQRITSNNGTLWSIVSSTAAGGGATTYWDGTTGFYLKTFQAVPLILGTNNTDRIKIAGDGKIGIGNSNPQVLLDTGANATAIGGLTNPVGYIGFDATGGGNSWGGVVIGSGVNGNNPFIAASRNGAGGALPLKFHTDGSERLTITSSGTVGINQSTPSAMLEVRSTASGVSQLYVTSAYAGDLATSPIYINKTDNSSLTTQQYIRFTMNNFTTPSGQINANGANNAAFGSYSDERLKENIVDLPSQWDAFKALRPVEFDYIDGSGHQIGFIAQEVEEIYPDLVGVGDGDYLTLTDMNKNDSRTIRVIKELIERVEALEALVA